MDKGTVMHRWMLGFQTQAPTVAAKYELSAIQGETTKTSFVYGNRTEFLKYVEFTASVPETCQILQPCYEIPAGVSAEVEVILRPAVRTKQMYLVVFAFDKNTETTEALSFSVNFLRP